MAAVTVFPVYERDHLSKLTQYLYVDEWQGLVEANGLKKYQVHHKATHYYNLEKQELVDFARQMEIEEAGITALRTLAEDHLEDLKKIAEGKTKSRRLF